MPLSLIKTTYFVQESLGIFNFCFEVNLFFFHLNYITHRNISYLKYFQMKPIISLETTFSLIDCESSFNNLQSQKLGEKSKEQLQMFAYYFARASWNGAKICFFQRSYESAALLYLILRSFQSSSSKAVFEESKKNLPEQELKKIFIYFAAVLQNAGNYKSFGDSKFVPDCQEESLSKFFLGTSYWSKQEAKFHKIYDLIKKYIFIYEQPYGVINFSDKKGTSGYYSSNISSVEAEEVKNATLSKLMSQNNRLIKTGDKEYTIRVASADKKQSEHFQVWGMKITVVYGQFSGFLKLLVQNLQKASNFAQNPVQKEMIRQYIEHFRTGDMKMHKESQITWIKDKQPTIQTNIGFIQSYLDPLKVRAQFQGFVAVVDKHESQILCKLVDGAEEILKYMTWDRQFQVQKFIKPDFTSLNILAFGSSGIPVGINIPNYDDVRQQHGFKNVNLGNAYGTPTEKSFPYTPKDQIPMHIKHYNNALFVIVALHQLLGHGSGRLLYTKANSKNPITGEEVTTSYLQNQTWHSVFGEIASTYEECRADSVALYLSLFQDVQELLLPGISKEERWEIVYCAWYEILLGAIKGLVHFDAKANKWLQAHIGASYAIFKVLQKKGGIFKIQKVQDKFQIHLDREAFRTTGKQAMGIFLRDIQFFKSTGNVKEGTKYFQQYLQVSETQMAYRQIVIANKRPRPINVQPTVQLVEGSLKYKNYEPNQFGCIDSNVINFGEDIENILEQWMLHNQEFKY